MAIQVQIRRDSTANIFPVNGPPFIPAQGELLMDTTRSSLFLGDGSTQGGIPVARSAGPNGSFMQLITFEAEITGMSGTIAVSSIQIPANSIVFAVSVYVVAAIQGATTFEVSATTGPNGGPGLAGQFGSRLSTGQGSQNYGLIGPTAWYSASTITLTAAGGNFTAGAVRIAIQCMTFGPPTA